MEKQENSKIGSAWLPEENKAVEGYFLLIDRVLIDGDGKRFICKRFIRETFASIAECNDLFDDLYQNCPTPSRKGLYDEDGVVCGNILYHQATNCDVEDWITLTDLETGTDLLMLDVSDNIRIKGIDGVPIAIFD